MSKDTILIVDDERFFCNLLQNILEKDYHTIVANNGDEAIDALNKLHVDLILLDIVMPETDGYELCEEIKSNPIFSTTPIIFLSVKNDPEDEIKGLNYGAVDYITKPINPPIVKARVEAHLALAKSRKKLQQQTEELEKLVALRTKELTKEIEDKQKVHEELHYLANYDQLTLLPNRNLFNERLAFIHKLAIRNECSFALLLIDLDRFKHVNDSLGHHIGDLLLKLVGQRLSACFRNVDTVSRLAGDEFTVILSELKNREDAGVVASKIISEIARPFEINDQTIHIGCSIGITVFPDDGKDLHIMLKNADIAMYEVKGNGKNSYAYFSPNLVAHANNRMELEGDLYTALANDELYLLYQPIISLKNNCICAVEVLLRWEHPMHGPIPAEKIISIAEDSDLIIKLGEWILQTACKQISLWSYKGITELQIAVSINMSIRQFESVAFIKKLFRHYKIQENAIHLEITESLMLADSELILESLTELKELGAQLSVDDFGTGYSSLSYLRKFPIDIIKIDQSFISNIGSSTGEDGLIRAIIAMARNLGLTVIAEGVETEVQLDFLQKHDCDQAQGFYFSQPVTASEIEEQIKEAGQMLKTKETKEINQTKETKN